MNLWLVLCVIGICGFVLQSRNVIAMLMCIEIILLSVTLIVVIASYGFDDILGQVYAIYIIVIAGAESAIGLGILLCFYRLRGSIAIES